MSSQMMLYIGLEQQRCLLSRQRKKTTTTTTTNNRQRFATELGTRYSIHNYYLQLLLLLLLACCYLLATTVEGKRNVREYDDDNDIPEPFRPQRKLPLRSYIRKPSTNGQYEQSRPMMSFVDLHHNSPNKSHLSDRCAVKRAQKVADRMFTQKTKKLHIPPLIRPHPKFPPSDDLYAKAANAVETLCKLNYRPELLNVFEGGFFLRLGCTKHLNAHLCSWKEEGYSLPDGCCKGINRKIFMCPNPNFKSTTTAKPDVSSSTTTTTTASPKPTTTTTITTTTTTGEPSTTDSPSTTTLKPPGSSTTTVTPTTTTITPTTTTTTTTKKPGNSTTTRAQRQKVKNSKGKSDGKSRAAQLINISTTTTSVAPKMSSDDADAPNLPEENTMPGGDGRSELSSETTTATPAAAADGSSSVAPKTTELSGSPAPTEVAQTSNESSAE